MANGPKKESAVMRKLRLAEEEKKREELRKKKKLIRAIVIVACCLVVVGCAIGIPLGIRARNNAYQTIELKNLCNADGSSLSSWVKALDGKKVEVTGYLLECTSYTRFLAGSSNAKCPFSTQKYVTNVIPAVYENGDMFSKSIDVNKPYKVYGRLHIGDTVIAQYYNSKSGQYEDEVSGIVLYVEKFELE